MIDLAPVATFAPVVMAGGVGSRLWPLSRASYPKQYQVLVDNPNHHTMLQQTFSRLHGLSQTHSQLICNQDHRFLAAEQLRKLGQSSDIVLEPMGRNTAAAVIIAALRLKLLNCDVPMLVLSADHAIKDEQAFKEALCESHELALLGHIVTLGITPSFACTGYGYIACGSSVSGTSGFQVKQFVEKPDLATAQTYLDSGQYLWNSGMFVVQPSVLLQQAAVHCAELLKQCQQVVDGATNDLDFVRLPAELFAQCESISLDYAIMERTGKAVVVPVTCGWSDVGDLNALWQTSTKDANGNVLSGDAVSLNSNQCIIKAEHRLVTALGVNNLAIVETKDAVLVAKLDASQGVKDLVGMLKGRGELEHQREVHRPWGSYDSVDLGPNYQVKRISVNPGARLSLQKHQYRAEHWVVVEGQAKVHVDGVDHLLKANDSIYIPVGAVHCLANETDELLHLVEVQSGSYLGEDDIERLEDLYGRQ
jgi:mannose-1-phosphate guanylyltransferase